MSRSTQCKIDKAKIGLLLPHFDERRSDHLRPIVKEIESLLSKKQKNRDNLTLAEVKQMMHELHFTKAYCSDNFARVYFMITGRTMQRGLFCNVAQ